MANVPLLNQSGCSPAKNSSSASAVTMDASSSQTSNRNSPESALGRSNRHPQWDRSHGPAYRGRQKASSISCASSSKQSLPITATHPYPPANVRAERILSVEGMREPLTARLRRSAQDDNAY